MHRSKLTAATMVSLQKPFTAMPCPLGTYEKFFLYTKNLGCSWMNGDEELETSKCSMVSVLCCFSHCWSGKLEIVIKRKKKLVLAIITTEVFFPF